MADMIDRKFKEDQPLNTVSRIRNALLHAGIFTVESWTDSGIEGCYSVRIEIAGTYVGQNGKGVTRELALASGYAELMERIQSGYFYVGAMDQELQAERGFIYSPGEIEFTVDEYAGQYGDILKPMMDRMWDSSEKIGVKDLLDGCKYGETLNAEKDFSALPFVNLDDGREVYFPVPILLDIYATNGTCAGNVKREAIVQGLSEIIERNHNLQVLAEGMTPPTIPEDYLKQFPVYSVIQEIRRDESCTLIVKDCSFGTGFPVIASILASRKSHKYIMKFGAHPVFEIALERSLTEIANDQLCENNDAGMFVTVWLGILDYKTGELQFANAGHNPPLLKKKNQEFVYMDSKTYKRSIVLGVRTGIRYKNNSLLLGRGDVLYLYTDGVTEANNEDKDLYGESRLRDLLESCWNQSAGNILKAVRSDIDDFAGDAEQFDDITMVVLKMQSASSTVSMDATYENTGKITEFAEKFLTEEDCTPKLAHQMIIALDEIYSNIVKYSHASDIELTCSVVGDAVYLTFSDNGIPYNPIEANEPDIALPIQERPIGGLGLHMVRKMMDYIDYKYEDDRNVFTIGKKDHSQG